jgi:hypothetical protein
MKSALLSTCLITLIAVLVGVTGAEICGCSGSTGGAGSGGATVSPLGQFVANVGACAEAEAKALASGKSVIEAATAVAGLFDMFATGDASTIETGLAGLIAVYGEPLIACAVVRGEAAPAQAAGSGSGSGSLRLSIDRQTEVRREIASKHGWQPATSP